MWRRQVIYVAVRPKLLDGLSNGIVTVKAAFAEPLIKGDPESAQVGPDSFQYSIPGKLSETHRGPRQGRIVVATSNFSLRIASQVLHA